jgi:beta-glucosidase
MHYDYKQSETINANTWGNNFYDPQWDFGHGLSYTSFEYSNLNINKKLLTKNEEINVTIDLKNSGNSKGKEVIQLYIRDHYASISPPLKKLKRFAKVELNPNEKLTINFVLDKDDLTFYGIENNWIVEDGKFSVIINDLKKEFNYKN